jgi:hypothetical protein
MTPSNEDDLINDFEKDYAERATQLMGRLDFNKLSEIRNKRLQDLTDEDLGVIGLCPITHDEIINLYCYTDLDAVKVYLNRVGDTFELRGYRLRKEKDILTTEELLDETLTKWKLKI